MQGLTLFCIAAFISRHGWILMKGARSCFLMFVQSSHKKQINLLLFLPLAKIKWHIPPTQNLP